MICAAKVKKKTVKSRASGENASPVDNNILLTLPPRECAELFSKLELCRCLYVRCSVKRGRPSNTHILL